jgi:cytochrome c oxidase subunit 4
VLVWVALMVLTAVTVAVWKMQMPYAMRVTVALSVAIAKATLVMLVFMHLWEHGGASRLVVATSGLFVVLLIGLTLADNATRFPYANPPYSAPAEGLPFESDRPPANVPPPPMRAVPEPGYKGH